MVRIAAIGDLHIRAQTPNALADSLVAVDGAVDVLIVAGDITNGGRLVEAEQAAELFASIRTPIIAVLGNHDRRCLRPALFRRTLERSGVRMLNGETTTLDIGGRVGFAGVAGCGGGFWPFEGPMTLQGRALKTLALRSKLESARLDAAITRLDTETRIVVMHFAPTTSTLGMEPLLKYWMLGNADLGRVIDRHRVDLVIHGHAHLGNPIGVTRGGTPVRNVASTVVGGVTTLEVGPRPSPRAVSRPWLGVGPPP